MRYHQLTQEERYQIYALKKAGFSNIRIAKELKRDKTSVGRELQRNRGEKGYRPKQAERFSKEREQSKKRSCIGEEAIAYIKEKIELKWSPEQISGRMKVEGVSSVSHETIYKYLQQDKKEGGELYLNLRHKNKRYKKRYGSTDNRGQIPNKRSIEDRPSIVEDKTRIGDVEIDLVIGKHHKQAIVTVVDRKSKFTLIQKVSSKKAIEVKEALIAMMRPFKDKIHTITADNGKEFSKHEAIAEALDSDFFFCHPYSSWERGLNENTNGLIRQFFPKGSEFTHITNTQILEVQNNLNYRPRKTLGYKTPYEVFYDIILERNNSA